MMNPNLASACAGDGYMKAPSEAVADAALDDEAHDDATEG